MSRIKYFILIFVLNFFIGVIYSFAYSKIEHYPMAFAIGTVGFTISSFFISLISVLFIWLRKINYIILVFVISIFLLLILNDNNSLFGFIFQLIFTFIYLMLQIILLKENGSAASKNEK